MGLYELAAAVAAEPAPNLTASSFSLRPCPPFGPLALLSLLLVPTPPSLLHNPPPFAHCRACCHPDPAGGCCGNGPQEDPHPDDPGRAQPPCASRREGERGGGGGREGGREEGVGEGEGEGEGEDKEEEEEEHGEGRSAHPRRRRRRERERETRTKRTRRREAKREAGGGGEGRRLRRGGRGDPEGGWRSRGSPRWRSPSADRLSLDRCARGKPCWKRARGWTLSLSHWVAVLGRTSYWVAVLGRIPSLVFARPSLCHWVVVVADPLAHPGSSCGLVLFLAR